MDCRAALAMTKKNDPRRSDAMPIHAETKDGLSLLKIEGDMTIYTAAELKAELMPYITLSVEHEIDLSGVSEIDSAGLQLLMLAKREAGRHASPLRLTGHSRAVLEVLDLCNLVSYFGDQVLVFRDAKH
jgi:anti-sigma B factor antagonist